MTKPRNPSAATRLRTFFAGIAEAGGRYSPSLSETLRADRTREGNSR